MPINRKLVEDAIGLMKKTPANYVYFFDTLISPEWIEPLWEYGFFKDPPVTIREKDPERGAVTTSFPPWPESRYLARVAGVAPDCVLKVMLQLEATDNAHVHWDLVEAACAMPACHAAKWAIQEADWVTKQKYLYMLLPDRLGKLVAHLAEGDETQAALAIAGSLLAIRPNLVGEDEDSDDWLALRARPRPKFEGYEYKHLLETCLPPLLSEAGGQTLSLLCELLDSALEETYLLRRRRQEEFDDFSEANSKPSIRGSVEQSELRADHLSYKIDLIGDDNSFISDAEDWLVAWIRDAGVQLIKNKQLTVEESVEMFEKHPWRIFFRISLYILRRFSDLAQDLIAERLTDSTVICYRFSPREYDLLLRDHFPKAPPETKREILAFIEQRVTIENIRDQLRDSDRTLFELQRQVNRWKLDRLSTIRSSLPPDWQRRYEELAALDGLEGYRPADPAHVSRPVVTTPGSPKSQEQLAGMSIDDIVAFLKTWDSPSWHESPNTLGRYLSNLVAANPQRFAQSAIVFKGLEATYVHAVIGGLWEAVKNGRAFDWEPVLELCQWVVSQPYEIPGRDPNSFDDHKDPHWGWSFKAVADLLQVGLAKGEATVPYSFRLRIWQLIEALTKDPEPTTDYEAKHQSSPTDGSISTTRGAAMHAVIAYARWVRGNFEEVLGFEWRGFDSVPEVRNVLERHLDLSQDPALAIRAVYGQHIPDLEYLDYAWTSAHLPCIFPHVEDCEDYWSAAWDSYIRFAKPIARVFHMLEGEYRHAIAQLADVTEGEAADSWALRRLAEELMYFCWQGDLKLDVPNALLSDFYTNAPSSLRAKAHESVGRWLQNEKDDVNEEVIQRLQCLWESRLRIAVGANEKSPYKKELAAFGWWFASGRFDDNWAIERLIESIRVGGSIDDKSAVVERLATLAPIMPYPVSRALRLIVEGSDYLRVYSFLDEAKKSLSTLLASDNEEAIHQARRTIDRLLSLGHRDCRDLLKSMVDNPRSL